MEITLKISDKRRGRGRYNLSIGITNIAIYAQWQDLKFEENTPLPLFLTCFICWHFLFGNNILQEAYSFEPPAGRNTNGTVHYFFEGREEEILVGTWRWIYMIIAAVWFPKQHV